jgi:hypothetical protein
VLAGEGHGSDKKDGIFDVYVQIGKTSGLEVFDDHGMGRTDRAVIRCP